MRIGLFVRTDPKTSLEATLARFVEAEASGFDTAWAGHTFEWDALTLLALAGRITQRIELASWVVPTPPRHPIALAQQALTAQAATGGRLTLGIGASHRAVIERRMGLDYARPLREMRELMSVLPGLLAGERVAHSGEVFRVSAQLSIAGVRPPPILLAALGPRMLELAGERADGAAIWLGGERFLAEGALDRIDAGARSRGRARPRVVVGLPIAVTTDPAAREAAERLLAASAKLPAYRRVLEQEQAATPGAVAILGDEAAVVERLSLLDSIGVTDFNAIPIRIPGDPGAGRRTRELLAGLAREPRRGSGELDVPEG